MAYKRKLNKSIRPVVLESPSPEFLPGVSLAELERSPEAQPKLVEENWWEELTLAEQSVLQVEGQGLAVALLVQGYSRLAIGAHLVKAQAILEPHSLFGKFLKLFRFTPRTAYRYIQRYQNASASLPETILRAAMARGIDMSSEREETPLGKYTHIVKALPPPPNPDPVAANAWIDRVVDAHKDSKSDDEEIEREFSVPVPQDPETLLKECYRFVATRYRKLPINSRQRSKWVHQLAGMLLNELGVSNALSIAPISVPEDYRVQRGRPREISVAA